MAFYSDIKDSPLSDLLRQYNIKTENNFMVLSHSSWKYFPDTARSTVAYIMFYQYGAIDRGTHVTGQVAQTSSESEYNVACTAGMALEKFRMLIHELLNKDPDIVTEEVPIVILDGKYGVYMSKNGKDTKNTRNITIRVN